MTFLEAAIEVLRTAEEALHFSEVAKRAVDGNLLSHVGRDPEAAMRSCLNSAVRAARNGAEPVLMRAKPGYYQIRPGAELPPPPAEPQAEAPDVTKKKTRNSKSEEPEAKAASKAGDAEPKAEAKSRRRRVKPARGEAPAPASVEVLPVRTKRTDAGTRGRGRAAGRKPASSRSEEAPASGASASDHPAVEFEAPSGSGLEGVTDVALVMANAMSRLVEERPELRDELDAIQHEANEAANTRTAPPARTAPPSRPAPPSEERSGRRRRRRRRRGKRVDWGNAVVDPQASSANVADRLLDTVCDILRDSGPRSLHVRQIAETLASRGVLGGEISEIERAVTAAILVDTQTHGRDSRFVARGDARYQLQATRLPDKAAASEEILRSALRAVEDETKVQLSVWLQSLGARALESLVRIWLAREGFSLRSALPPSRGLGKLVVDDPDSDSDDDEGRTLVLVIPKRTALDPSLWDGEAARHNCSATLAFVMGDVGADHGLGDARIVGVGELSSWLVEHGVGVEKVTLSATVLDPTLIESIGGLDT